VGKSHAVTHWLTSYLPNYVYCPMGMTAYKGWLNLFLTTVEQYDGNVWPEVGKGTHTHATCPHNQPTDQTKQSTELKTPNPKQQNSRCRSQILAFTNVEIHHRIFKNISLDYILSRFNVNHILKIYFSIHHFNIIFPFWLASPDTLNLPFSSTS